jgi:transcriptional regulator with XRE-family HTH domain
MTTAAEQFREIYEARACRLVDIASKSGVAVSTVMNMRLGRNTSLANFEAVCNALGYRVTVEKVTR